MKRKNSILFITIALLQLTMLAGAAVRLPALVSENMVLQQQSKAAIWGWAEAGETVEVKGSWNNQPVKTKADAKGNWKLLLTTGKAGGPYQLVIKGNNTITLNNILLGEVWLCSGQSNMEFPLGKQAGWRTGVRDYEKEVPLANEPLMRLFTVKQQVADEPQTDVTGNWNTCTPEAAAKFSAVAYYFAKKIIRETGLPVGLIHSSWGGTPAESWTKKEVLESDADLQKILQQYESSVQNYPSVLKGYESTVANKEMPAPRKPVDPARDPKSPTMLYNAMIHPLIPFTLKGVIWYQGESNSGRAHQYRKLFPALISSWRKEWGADLPFYFVQIAPHYQQSPGIREAQLFTYKSVSNTGMVVTTDAGDSLDIHPRNKTIVGERLAAWALAKQYGRKETVYSGPLYKSMQVQEEKIIINFEHTGTGLVAKDGPLKEFMIAGADRQFVPAQAVIEGNTVTVTSSLVHEPVAVRFAWKRFPRPNLFNGAGFPASPFRTDDWEQLSIKDAIQPAVKNGGFKMEGYILWCPSVIKVGNTYHMFASRWPEQYGLGGWTKYSEIVRATADNLYGPYTFKEVVIQKRDGYWDNDRAHNPKIVKTGNKYVLYYISSANETGYAYADSITGPWTRTDHVAMPFSNPAPLIRKDGSVYVFGRKSVNDIRIAQGYEATAFDKIYSILSEGKNLLPGQNQLEDPTIWWASDQYNVILSDFRGDLTGINKNGAQYYSKDGVNYKPVTKESIYTKTISYDDGSNYTFRRRERPFVYVNEKGEVTAFFTSCLTAKEQSWIEVNPVELYVPEEF